MLEDVVPTLASDNERLDFVAILREGLARDACLTESLVLFADGSHDGVIAVELLLCLLAEIPGINVLPMVAASWSQVGGSITGGTPARRCPFHRNPDTTCVAFAAGRQPDALPATLDPRAGHVVRR